MVRSGIIKQFLPLVVEMLAQGKSRKEVVVAVMEKFPAANARTVSVQVYLASKKQEPQEPQTVSEEVK